MTVYRQALGNLKLVILSLSFALLLSTGVSSFLGILLYRVPTHQTIHIPARIPMGGLDVKLGQISNATVYDFTYHIWQAIKTWQQDGQKDYQGNIKQWSAYLTPSFQNVLKKDAKKTYEAGFLAGHQQMTFGMNGASYDKKDVKYMGHGTWLVHLKMRTINVVSPENGGDSFKASHVVRDAITSFVFKVIYYPYAVGKNQEQLAIAGFAAPPKVIKINQ